MYHILSDTPLLMIKLNVIEDRLQVLLVELDRQTEEIDKFLTIYQTMVFVCF